MILAGIERLPVEILQPVFVLSGYNPALARASHILGARLSSEYMYDKTCDFHLTNTCDDYFNRSAAQTAIFASKWMTWDFFKCWIIRTYEAPGCLCGQTPDQGCFDAQWPPDFENSTSMIFSRSHFPRVAFIRGRLPKKLLAGPWTSEKVQFLRFLLWLTSMSVDWKDPESRVLAVQGRRQAFLENNLEAVELFNHNRRLGRPPTMDTLYFAVKDAGCSRSIIYDTLRSIYVWTTRKETLDHAPLLQWCDERIWENDTKGVWLRGVLQCLIHAEVGKSHDVDSLFSTIVGTAVEAYGESFDDTLITKALPWNKVSYCFLFFQQIGERCSCKASVYPCN